jgi:Ca2+-binding EF-hand superfamily protein
LEPSGKLLTDCSFFLKKVEAQALLKFYDKDGDGHVCYEEFIRGLKEPLNIRRKALVQKVF